MKKYTGPLMLLLTALIWGTAFVAQSVGMDYVGPFTFNAVRSLIGGVFLIPCMLLLQKLGFTRSEEQKPGDRRTLLLGGVCCGAALAVASSLQQIGIQYTTVGKGGFITALYVILVPICGLFFHKKVPALVWGCVGLSVVGLHLLCVSGATALNKGDVLMMFSAAAFTAHILVIDHFSPLVNGVKLSCIQFLVCGTLCSVPMLALEHPRFQLILNAWQPILYAGILSCGVAYTLQVVAQGRTNPTVASLIMCMESVFSAVAGWIILGQSLSAREIIGCLLMFAAIVLANLFGSGESTAKLERKAAEEH